MSYCRYSSDDWRSDLYCYQSDEGYVTHVAANRTVGDAPRVDYDLLVSEDAGDRKKWMEQHIAQMDWLDTAEYVPIGGPYDGVSFIDETLEEFRDRLVMLRDAGYRFPDSVLNAVEGEIADREATL